MISHTVYVRPFLGFSSAHLPDTPFPSPFLMAATILPSAISWFTFRFNRFHFRCVLLTYCTVPSQKHLAPSVPQFPFNLQDQLD